MFKLIIMGILASTISSLTGIPAFPVTPVIANNTLEFKPTSVDVEKLEKFKRYVGDKF